MANSSNNPLINVMLAVIILLLLLLLSIQASRRAAGRIAADFFYPFLSLPVKAERSTASQAVLLQSRDELAAALDKAERLNAKQAAQLTTFTVIKEENSELRHLLALRSRATFSTVFAEIMLRDPLEWDSRFTIDKGSDNGIHPGNLVVTAIARDDGTLAMAAVGRIGTVSRRSAEVITLAADNSSLSVKLPANGACGLINGGYRRGNNLYAKLQYLPRDLDYLPGMAAVTSGMTEETPPNVMIGKLAGAANAIKIKDNLYATAEVMLAADLSRIRFVMILTGDKK